MVARGIISTPPAHVALTGTSAPRSSAASTSASDLLKYYKKKMDMKPKFIIICGRSHYKLHALLTWLQNRYLIKKSNHDNRLSFRVIKTS